jgi:hypothetical protein
MNWRTGSARLVGDVLRNAAREVEQRAGEAAVEQEQRVLGLDAPGVDLELLHVERGGPETTRVILRERGIGRDDIAHLRAVRGRQGVPVACEVEQQAVVLLGAASVDEVLEGPAQCTAVGVLHHAHAETAVFEQTAHGHDIVAHAGQVRPVLVLADTHDQRVAVAVQTDRLAGGILEGQPRFINGLGLESYGKGALFAHRRKSNPSSDEHDSDQPCAFSLHMRQRHGSRSVRIAIIVAGRVRPRPS